MGFPLFHGIPNPLLIHGKFVNELTEAHLGMVYTTYKNGDDGGMVYYCFNMF